MAAARLTFVNLLQKCLLKNKKELFLRGQYSYLNGLRRSFASGPAEYNEKDPAPMFFSPNIQIILKYLTRPNVEKVFRRRTNKGVKALSTPEYKFMTDEELQEEVKKALQKADYLLHMPPVVKVYGNIDTIISKDPALVGHDTSRFIFTDITFGVKNSERFVTIREPDGTLRHADHDTRKKFNQIYLPIEGRRVKEPAMFTDDKLFQDLLLRKEYEFVLDRACIQYEPEDHTYHRITSQVYQHVDQNKEYNILRSTRHFGPMTFFLAWHNTIDNLLLEILQTGYIREAVSLINLQRTLNPGLVESDDSQILIEEIIRKQISITEKADNIPLDVELEEKCMECIDRYIKNNSSMKASQELALQSHHSLFKSKLAVDSGIKMAHGAQ